jgi:hypothetical protein
LHPEEPPVTDHDIGVVVQVKEWGDCLHAVLNVAPEENLGRTRDITAEQYVYVAEIPGEEHLWGDSANGNAGRAVVDAVNVVFTPSDSRTPLYSS